MSILDFTMKPINLFVTLLFIPAFVNAQDSCKIKNETDSYTKQSKLSTGFISFPTEAKLAISIDATATEIDFFFWIREEGKCFDDESTAQINYEGDRLKANFKNTGSMNCQGAFHFNFKNSQAIPSNLKRFTEKGVTSIKLTGPNKTITQITFSEAQKKQFQKMVNCIVLQSKTLIK